jgi:uncharacterized protein YkwD
MITSIRLALILTVILITSGTVAFAQNATQKRLSRPEARLISSGPIPPESYPSRVVHLESRRTSSVSTTPQPAPSYNIASLERRAFDLINAQRQSRGQQALPWDPALARLARQHSENMARGGFLDHTEPGGMSMVRRAHAQGIKGWKALGENIAYNQGYDDPAAFVAERWMISNMHRENLLNSRWTRSAVGVAIASDGRVFFTQLFIAP